MTLFSGILYPWVAFVQGLVVPTLDIPIHRINNYPRQKYSVWSRVRHCRIASVWAKMSPSNPCPGSFWRTSNCVSKEKEIEKCNFSSCKIFLKQYFGLNFRRLTVKQEPKSKEYDVHKRCNFPRLPGPSLYECIKGWLCRSTCLIESPSLDVRECKVMSKQRRLATTQTRNCRNVHSKW